MKLTIPLLISFVVVAQGCGHKNKSKRKLEPEPPISGPVVPDPGLKLTQLPLLEGARISVMTGDVLPPAQASHSAGRYEDHSRLLVSEFGTDIERASNDIYVYDLAAEKWSHLANPASPITFDSPAALLTKESLFVLGGFDSDMCGTRSNGQIHDLSDKSWKKIAVEGEPSARGQADIHSYQKKFLVFGGYRQLGSGCDTTDENAGMKSLVDGGIYDPASNSWALIPAIPLTADEKNARSLVVTSTLSGDILYVLLSDHIRAQIDNLWMFDLLKMEWSQRPVKMNQSLDGSFHALLKTPKGLLVWQNSWAKPNSPSRYLYEPPMLTYFEGFVEQKSVEFRYRGSDAFIFPEAELPGEKYLVSMSKEYTSPRTSYGIASLQDMEVKRLEKIDGETVTWKYAGAFLMGYFKDRNSKVGLVAYDLKDGRYLRLPDTSLKYRTFSSWQYDNGKFVLWGGFNPTESRNPREWDYPGDGVVIELPAS